jgi:hypothetical protein
MRAAGRPAPARLARKKAAKTGTQIGESNSSQKAPTIEAPQTQGPEVVMDNVTEIAALLRQQASLEH